MTIMARPMPVGRSLVAILSDTPVEDNDPRIHWRGHFALWREDGQ